MSEEIDIDSEDYFMSQVMNESNENNDLNESNDESMPFGLKRLLTEPLKIPRPELELGCVSQTPRNPFASNNDRKRKNPTRRCLSEVLDNSSYNVSPERDLSPTFFSFVQKSKENFSLIQSCSSQLSPIFTKVKTTLTSTENSENDSMMANVSMTSVCSPLFSSEVNPMKRPNTPKIRKSNSLVTSEKKRISFVRSFSANEAQIKKAVEMSCSIPSLIGDCSKPYALPLIQGRHQDLKSISVDVLAQVLEGHYNDLIEECIVVDCRYPYEYNGGHIRGAKNIYSQEAILQEFIRNKTTDPNVNQNDNKRHILIFHCEFSSERGPTLSRFLRNNDRSHNKDSYPQLHYPEIYLLEGGYKAFFEKYPNLCEPSEYLPMLSKDHEQELRRFRSLVRSLSTDGKCFGSVFKTGNKGY